MLTKNIRQFSVAFSKGRLTMAKLKDKVTIDNKISNVNLLFGDQYGRIHGLKLDAEYLLEEYNQDNQVMFQFNQNPFQNDIGGKQIDLIADTEGKTLDMPTTLRLKPDYSTLRVAPWLSKEAYIISDLFHPDEDKPIDFAPRTILKQALLKPSFVSSSCIKQLTFQLSKVSSDSPPLADQLTSNNQGVLMTDNIHFDMINSLTSTLREVGVPINSIQPVQGSYKDQFMINLKSHTFDNTLNMCDSFTIAKMVMKTACLQKDYDINFAPNDGGVQNQINLEFGLNDSDVSLSPKDLLVQQALLNPTINSWRKTKALGLPIDKIISQKEKGLETGQLLSPDINMYLAMSQLLTSFGKHEKSTDEINFATSYDELVLNFSENDKMSKDAHMYYMSLFEQEWKEFLESTTFEMGRIY